MSSQGIPNARLSTAFVKSLLNESTIDSWTYKTFKAVQRCPLNDKLPEIHSLTACSKSASGSIIPGFLASKPKTNRSLFLLGCKSCSDTAEELCPINAITSIIPVFIIGDAILLPLPKSIFTTPGGKLS